MTASEKSKSFRSHQDLPAVMTQADALLAYLSANRESMVAFLSDLVRAESPSTSPEAQAAPLTILWEALHDLGFKVEIVPGRASGGYLLAVQQRDSDGAVVTARQLLIGHCDTVWPLGTLKTMPLLIEDNVVRGPGAYDMKGGLTQMIFALRAIRAVGASPSLVPVVLVNSDEEIGSAESLPAIRRQAQLAERAFVLEPALGLRGKIKTTRKGVGRFEVLVRGRAAHAGLDPEKGISAVLALSYIVQGLHDLNDREKGISVNVGLIEGGLGANVVPPLGRAVVDVRVPTQQDADRLEAIILGLEEPMPGVRVQVSGQFGRPPLEPTAANRRLWAKAQQLAGALGLQLEESRAGGASDGNYTSQYTATLDGLGAVGDGAHAQHEFLLIDKMIERTALLALLLLSP